MELQIDLSAVRGANLYDLDQFTDAVFIYQLTRDGKPFYVGSTTNPTSRLLAHLALTTKDTDSVISEMQSLGEVLGMTILDLTRKADRYVLESVWINTTPNVVNTDRYPTHYAKWKACPRCFRAYSTNTLKMAHRPN